MVLGGMVMLYGPPLFLAVGALLISSSHALPKIVYLAVFLGLSISLTTLIAVSWPDAVGPWAFIFGPAVVIAAIRLVVALVIDLPSGNSVGE
ncbi:hypothetical protein AB0O34_27720 [Sphaerisporangium sp. NPDC088356]|uniref:hypothetical protein n=1 Tax=Sphaerisporangium sp. NPDC088356 TaxID=3154871 RepID=UPI00341DDD5A